MTTAGTLPIKIHLILRRNWNNRFTITLEKIAAAIIEFENDPIAFDDDLQKNLKKFNKTKDQIKTKIASLDSDRKESLMKLLIKGIAPADDPAAEIAAICQMIESQWNKPLDPIQYMIITPHIAWSLYHAVNDAVGAESFNLQVLHGTKDRSKSWKRDFKAKRSKHIKQGLSESAARRKTFYDMTTGTKSQYKKHNVVSNIKKDLIAAGISKDHSHRLSTFFLSIL